MATVLTTSIKMTITKDVKGGEPEIVFNAEPDSTMVTAVGVEEKPGGDSGAGGSNESPIPVGHSRFYCSKCRSVRKNQLDGGRYPHFLAVIICHRQEDVLHYSNDEQCLSSNIISLIVSATFCIFSFVPAL